MKVATGLKILLGVGIGFVIGLKIDDDEREHMMEKVRGKIVFALTGDPKDKERFQKRVTYKKPVYSEYKTYTTKEYDAHGNAECN